MKPQRSFWEVDVRVAGIPCIAAVTDFGLDGDDINWILCDRNGHVAPWLEKKCTLDDNDKIRSKIYEELTPFGYGEEE